jgi:hypothetical protein
MNVSERLRQLELRSSTGAKRIDVIIRTFVRPSVTGPEAAPLKGLRSPCGWHVARENKESREDFLTRASNLAPRLAGGIAVLREVM